MKKEQYNLGGHSYILQNASAAKQRSLLNMLCAKVTVYSATFTDGENINEAFLRGILAGLTEEDLIAVENILLPTATETDTQTTLDIKHFENRMADYYDFLAHSIYFNLSDFFMRLDAENKENRESQKLKAEQTISRKLR